VSFVVKSFEIPLRPLFLCVEGLLWAVLCGK
jgi:hypothetical protein